MQLFFRDPSDGRLAIDTDKKEYCCNYLKPYVGITGPRKYILVQRAIDLYVITSEMEKNGWTYNAEMLEPAAQK